MPRYYTWREFDTTIEVYPVPDAEYGSKLHYYSLPTEITVTSGTTEWLGIDDVLVEAVKYRLFASTDQMDRAANSLSLLQGLLTSESESQRNKDLSIPALGYQAESDYHGFEPHLHPWVRQSY